MPFDLHIKNIGKLTDAKLRIGRFTVLAGPNNTGKSFVSKILYSVFDAMNGNPVAVQMHMLTAPIRENLFPLRRMLRGNTTEDMGEAHANTPHDDLKSKIREMEALAAEQSLDDPAEIDRFLATVNDMAKSLSDLLPEIRSLLQTVPERSSSSAQRRAEYYFAELEKSLDVLQKGLAGMTAQQFIVAGIHHTAKGNLLQNFQTSNLAKLRAQEEHESKISIEEIGEFDLVNGDIKPTIHRFGLQTLQQYSKVIYLESPVYWKLKNALEDMRLSDRHRRHARRELLTGIPGYFYDLASMFRVEYTGEMDFPELYARLTGDDVIGGKLVISETGELLFHEVTRKNGQESSRSFPLSLTSTGIINLGILALLIERKIMDKESFIFIDEPEAHLHPAWQVVMAEALFELAKGGAHVVIATHSIDMLKWLEVHAKKNPQDNELIALNQFPAQNGDGDARDFDEKMASILQELTDPFAKTFIAGV